MFGTEIAIIAEIALVMLDPDNPIGNIGKGRARETGGAPVFSAMERDLWGHQA
jgi:hypothetical protein